MKWKRSTSLKNKIYNGSKCPQQHWTSTACWITDHVLKMLRAKAIRTSRWLTLEGRNSLAHLTCCNRMQDITCTKCIRGGIKGVGVGRSVLYLEALSVALSKGAGGPSELARWIAPQKSTSSSFEASLLDKVTLSGVLWRMGTNEYVGVGSTSSCNKVGIRIHPSYPHIEAPWGTKRSRRFHLPPSPTSAMMLSRIEANLVVVL